ncbi:hypothetical protein KFK09_024805 [Dendrobium nobile]|uniref:Reverse transcriptase n=1 Tax=Dendrobium nobile TaxID=94219 RepID=A0A8T3AEZ5_DENNO|nr:hypothetical protein KFK09_024805 [Dendrobium nobile]
MLQVNWIAPIFPDNSISGMLRLWAKMARLKQCIRYWNKNVFKNIFSNILEAEHKVLDMEDIFEANPSEDNLSNLNQAKNLLSQLQVQEESFWKQKANTKFVMEGDRNTKFFHDIANKNKINNRINKIRDSNGILLENDDDISKSGVDFFLNMFNTNSVIEHVHNPSVIPNLITDADNFLLCQIPLENEILEVLKDMNCDATAGPDGFTTMFFQKSWEIIKIDVIAAVQDFFSGRTISDNVLLAQELTHDINTKSTGVEMVLNIPLQMNSNDLILSTLSSNGKFKLQNICRNLAVYFGIKLEAVAVGIDDIFVYWIKPKLPFVKLNTDGSVGVDKLWMAFVLVLGCMAVGWRCHVIIFMLGVEWDCVLRCMDVWLDGFSVVHFTFITNLGGFFNWKLLFMKKVGVGWHYNFYALFLILYWIYWIWDLMWRWGMLTMAGKRLWCIYIEAFYLGCDYLIFFWSFPCRFDIKIHVQRSKVRKVFSLCAFNFFFGLFSIFCRRSELNGYIAYLLFLGADFSQPY